MIGTIDVEIMAANPSMPLYPVRAFKNSPSSIRLRNVPKRIGNWNINAVQIVAAYPDSSIKTANCVLTGGVWVGTIEGCPISGRSENGLTVFASGIDENGNPVSNYVLGKGLIEILEGDGTITPDAPSYYVHLLDEEPTTPKEGDMWQDTDHIWYIYQDGSANRLDEATWDELQYVAQTANDAYSDASAALGKAVVLEELIPAQASTQNQLADKAFVNSSVQTATANFRGNWGAWGDVPDLSEYYPADYTGSKTPTVNDYLVVQDASGYDGQQTLEGTWRFKYSGTWATDGKNGWLPEYQVNETPMTAAQLAAINSNITAAKVSQYDEALAHIETPDYSIVTISPTTTTEILPSIFPITLEYEGYTETILEDEVYIDWWEGDIYLNTQHFTPGTEDTICAVDGTTGKYKYSDDFSESLRFNGVQPTTDTQVVETTTKYNLQNRAINTISVDASTSTYNLVFPTLSSGYSRDFSVRAVAISGTYSTPPLLTVPSEVTITNNGGELPDIATSISSQCITMIDFTEVAANQFVATSPMTEEQLEAINSNITAAKVAQYDEALTKFNYELYSPMRETMTLRQDIFPITYTDNNTTYTVQYSDYGTTLTVVETSTLGASSTSIYLAHNNGTTNPTIVAAKKTTGLCDGGILNMLNVKLNGSKPTIGTTPIYDVSGGLVLKNRAINRIPLSQTFNNPTLVFPQITMPQANDFILHVEATGSGYTPSLSYPNYYFYNDSGDKPEIELGKQTLIYISFFRTGGYLLKEMKLQEVAMS